ncbi:P-loop containing nucleoside triphosphate hydrolase protein [Coniochaeta ligniaria NRRL 30616]|uniref:p-loop containing nucleoside triphosphate hydrolase protein n=1 Tax=Coniochaeta ligniaria NRRL 30616 TaxID=1408157 RepID=A0A1J7JYU2_9PEZI|nr:P-loop containing nucleoside triphosphate hydrolase protein [Coniochaeta ligniaria NRRL 30616]
MSVFTYDPDPPRVSSPWHRSEDPGKKVAAEQASDTGESFQSGLLSDYGVTKLEPEPQEGPTEYKLHLLLRPRKSYTLMGTSNSSKVISAGWAPPSPSPQTRQARLEHLTTQLLWRLQQSVPYHAASTAVKLVVPKLHGASIPRNGHVEIGKLVPGLEASRGALYEIGVADDGSLVGLTSDELDESLATLRVMGASLGCNMKILRKVIVGECERASDSDEPDDTHQSRTTVAHTEQLWVAEVLVTPELGGKVGALARNASVTRKSSTPISSEALPGAKQGPLTQDQLRVTLTGPTTSGKSTLLGTLSMGSLDNGHGKSRLSLLKHLHEVASGLTSSVAQELIGYKQNSIFNYTHRGIESWIDIHDFTRDGRLVHLLDSAGHPRFRRTILRGIVGWAPHWTLLCIAADGTDGSVEMPSAQDSSGVADFVPDLAQAHLDLCLSLDLPLAVVITKMDLASRPTLHRTLGKILSKIKATGRITKILQPDNKSDEHLAKVPLKDVTSVSTVIDAIHSADTLQRIVPIVLTSAVKGTGIGLIHALLQSLPLPPTPTSHDYTGPALNPEQPSCLFHIEDRFSLPASYASLTPSATTQSNLGTVVAGYLRFGSLSVGDKVLIGPFESEEDGLRGTTPEDRPSPGSYGLSMSHPSSTELGRIAMRNAVSASTIKGEWHNAHIVSIHNLRLPVQTLQAGQVGSIGIVLDLPKEEDPDSPFEARPPSVPKLRKGMVLAIPSKHMVDTGLSLQAASGLTASFPNMDVARLTSGLLITIYVASVRSAARVLRVSRVLRPHERSGTDFENNDNDVFNLDNQMEADAAGTKEVLTGDVEVQLELLTNREWMELGSRVVILEGAGLDCIVGKVVEIVD